MSNSLIQKSLELLEDDKIVKQGKIRKRTDKGILDLIPVNHRLTSKRNKSHKDIIKRPKRVTVYEAKKRLEAKTDPTEENIEKLLLLGKNKLNSKTADKLFERAVKKHYILKEEKQEEKTTIFTEEEFKQLESEFFIE